MICVRVGTQICVVDVIMTCWSVRAAGVCVGVRALAWSVRALDHADAAVGAGATTTRAQQKLTQQVRAITQCWPHHALLLQCT